MRKRFVLADVFTRSAFGGNQLAVFPDAEGMSATVMQQVAREFNFPETTFVFPPRDSSHTSHVRIFTPAAEVPFAGHPTIGTAAVLATRRTPGAQRNDASLRFLEGVGIVEVAVKQRDGVPFARLTLDTRVDTAPAPSAASVATVLSVGSAAVIGTWFASVGLRFCFAHLASPKDVDRARLDPVAWHAVLSTAWSSNIFLFAGSTNPGSTWYARMFAPALGIAEDPATGSACAALAGSIANRFAEPDGVFEWRIEQGVTLGRPSEIYATATTRRGATASVQIAGYSVIVGEGEMTAPRDS